MIENAADGATATFIRRAREVFFAACARPAAKGGAQPLRGAACEPAVFARALKAGDEAAHCFFSARHVGRRGDGPRPLHKPRRAIRRHVPTRLGKKRIVSFSILTKTKMVTQTPEVAAA